MTNFYFTKTEKAFLDEVNAGKISARMPYITVESFPKLGLLSALSFLEWVNENPKGVISLSTGKTAQYFLKFLHQFLENWDDVKWKGLREKYGLKGIDKPVMDKLQFVQMAEFYPIDPLQHNSLCNYVQKYYISDFGMDVNNSLVINSNEIKLAENKHFGEVFPDSLIDLSLRFREAKTYQEKLQQQSILNIDDWCTKYEQKIRDKGGIGFFMGGIGPDGHIAFNTRGSDHFSATRLTQTNFETQAITATDLGGIEVSKNRLVITIGLGTINYNPECKAIVYAAGEAIADTVKSSLENKPDVQFPATAFQKLKNSRFYLTKGAAVNLEDSIDQYFFDSPWNHKKTERAVMELCKRINKFGSKLTLNDLKADKYCSHIPGLNENTVQSVIDTILSKIKNGTRRESDQVFYHTGPHHDDIMLGIMPLINRQTREASNKMHFSVLTSGFTAVTNHFLSSLLKDTIQLLNSNNIEMVNYPDFFESGYKSKWDKDVYHYLDSIAANDDYEKRRGVCHRCVRAIVSIWGVKSKTELIAVINDLLDTLKSSYDGGKNPPGMQKLKGMIRELEEELVWAHYGIQVANVHHLRLGFYQGDVFGSQPDTERDVMPIVEEFRKYNPTVISLAMDPQGSGPDTHYKVLQAIARAVEIWSREKDLSHLRIHGYRNVWFRYNPWDVEMIVPVSLNALATLDKSFTECYVTQVNASFPSYRLDGKFSELTQRVWLEQHKQIQLLLGKDFFYLNESSLLRATHGFVYLRELNVREFLDEAFSLEKSTEGLF